MPKLRKPSLKQRKFAKEYLRHGNAKKAALEAYDTHEARAGAIGSQTLRQEHVQKLIKDALEEEGLSNSKIAESLNKIVDAGISKRSLKKVTPSDTLKAIEMGSKLKDIFPATRKHIATASVNLDLTGKSEEELNKILANLGNEAKTFSKMIEKE